MPYDPLRHRRRSIRLPGYDYAQAGAYYVTICVQGSECRFGEVVDGEMRLNEAGCMVQSTWQQLPGRFPMLQLDTYVVMPNHFHAIVVITNADPGPVGAPLVGAPLRAPEPGCPYQPPGGRAPVPGGRGGGHDDPPGGRDLVPVRPALGDMIGAFKSLTTDAFIVGVRQSGWPAFDRRLWQRGYWDHIVRSDAALQRIRHYITTNPQRWEQDRQNRRRRGEDGFYHWLETQAPSQGDPGRRKNEGDRLT